MNHLQKLKSLKGKSHMYNGKTTVINDYEIDTEGLHLKVSIEGKNSEMLVPVNDAHEFFNEMLPLDNPGNTLEIYSNQQQSLTQMRQQLMSLNAKLMGEDSAKYLKQAKAVNNNINTLINSLKLEFQIAKEIKRSQP